MRVPKFEVFRGKVPDNDWYFHLRAANGEIIAASEGYKTKAGAIRGAGAMRRNAEMANIIVKE